MGRVASIINGVYMPIDDDMYKTVSTKYNIKNNLSSLQSKQIFIRTNNDHENRQAHVWLEYLPAVKRW